MVGHGLTITSEVENLRFRKKAKYNMMKFAINGNFESEKKKNESNRTLVSSHVGADRRIELKKSLG